MKREDLVKLGLSEDVVNQIMALHGSDIESHKAKLTTAQEEAKATAAQLAEAQKAIEGFKGMDIEGIKKAADDYKAQAEQARKDADAQVAAIRFDTALSSALTGAKVRDVVSVKAHLKADALKLVEDGSILGLKEQLEALKSTKDFLFESDAPTPQIVLGGNNHAVTGDPIITAARKAAGLDAK